MHRTQRKHVTKEAALLKRLREHRNLSMPQVASLIEKSISWISHVENGRMDLTSEHIKLLLPLYGQTQKSFESYLSGAVLVQSKTRRECIDALQSLPDNLVDRLHPLIVELTHMTKTVVA